MSPLLTMMSRSSTLFRNSPSNPHHRKSPVFLPSALTPGTSSSYLIRAIPDVPYTFEQMRTSVFGHELRPLITYLSENVHNPNIICALMYVFLLQVLDKELCLSLHFQDIKMAIC